jgi:hypothetical protein
MMGHQNDGKQQHRLRCRLDLHGSDARQQEIADNLSKRAREELKRGSKRVAGRPERRQTGTQRARSRNRAS